MLGLELRYMELQLCHGYVGGCAAAPHSPCWCCCCLLPMLLVAGWTRFCCCCYCWSCSLVSFLPHVIKLDTTTFFWVTWFVCFLLVLYSPSPPVSVPYPTQALTFDPALGVVFAVVVVVWFSWGSLVVIPNKWFFSTRIFSPNRVYVFFVVDWSPSIKRRVARLSGYILPKWWVIESRVVI